MVAVAPTGMTPGGASNLAIASKLFKHQGSHHIISHLSRQWSQSALSFPLCLATQVHQKQQSSDISMMLSKQKRPYVQ
jgi:hypothetical protein